MYKVHVMYMFKVMYFEKQPLSGLEFPHTNRDLSLFLTILFLNFRIMISHF